MPAPKVAPPLALGIDLSNPAVVSLLHRLYHARYSAWVLAAGGDPSDCLSDVYLAILARNAGTRPYDPSRSALSTYCTWVIRSTVSHYIAKIRRRAVLVYGRSADVATLAGDTCCEADMLAAIVADDPEHRSPPMRADRPARPPRTARRVRALARLTA